MLLSDANRKVLEGQKKKKKKKKLSLQFLIVFLDTLLHLHVRLRPNLIVI
jgi:hypothetical protein